MLVTWSSLKFGRHRGKTLPQVVFLDPDWFFWAMEKHTLNRNATIAEEAEAIDERARHIRIPEGSLAEYIVAPVTNRFADLRLVPADRPPHEGASPTFRRDVIDLSVARQISEFDKTGGRLLERAAKKILFGNSNHKMTKGRCEAFFNNDENFALG